MGADHSASDGVLLNMFGVTEDQFCSLAECIEKFWNKLEAEAKVDYS